MRVELADGLDVGRDETVVDVLNESVVMHEIRADEAVGLSNDGQPLRLSKGKPQPLTSFSASRMLLTSSR